MTLSNNIIDKIGKEGFKSKHAHKTRYVAIAIGKHTKLVQKTSYLGMYSKLFTLRRCSYSKLGRLRRCTVQKVHMYALSSGCMVYT